MKSGESFQLLGLGFHKQWSLRRRNMSTPYISQISNDKLRLVRASVFSIATAEIYTIKKSNSHLNCGSKWCSHLWELNVFTTRLTTIINQTIIERLVVEEGTVEGKYTAMARPHKEPHGLILSSKQHNKRKKDKNVQYNLIQFE